MNRQVVAMGGGIAVGEGVSAVLNRTVLSDNSAGWAGGAIVIGSSTFTNVTSSLEINDSQIRGNSAGSGGGFMLGTGVNRVELNRSEVSDNMATTLGSPMGGGSGGGILMLAQGSNKVDLNAMEVSGNSAVCSGGGIQMNGTLTVGSDSRISGNESSTLHGDSQSSRLHVTSGGVISTDAFGESLSAVRTVTIEGTLLASVNSATQPIDVINTLTLSTGSALRVEADGSLGSAGEHQLQVAQARRLRGEFDHTPEIGEHLGFGVFVAEFEQSRSAVSYADDQITINLFQAGPGDVNADGVFDSSDLIKVFQAGEYEDGISNNSDFVEGDWNHDGEFDSADLVMAFQHGSYTTSATAALSSRAAAIDFLFRQDELKRGVV